MSGIETNNVVERLRALARQQADGTDFHKGRQLTAEDTMYWCAADEIEQLRAERQSLSDRIDVQEALLRRAGWLIGPYCGADEALRIFRNDVTASLTQGGKNV